jgi:chromosome segregation ATPase
MTLIDREKSAQEELNKSIKMIAAMKQTIVEHQETKMKLEGRISGLEEACENAETVRLQLEKRLSVSGEEYKALEARLQTCQNALAEVQLSNTSEMNRLHNQNSELKMTTTELKQEVDSLNRQLLLALKTQRGKSIEPSTERNWSQKLTTETENRSMFRVSSPSHFTQKDSVHRSGRTGTEQEVKKILGHTRSTVSGQGLQSNYHHEGFSSSKNYEKGKNRIKKMLRVKM